MYFPLKYLQQSKDRIVDFANKHDVEVIAVPAYWWNNSGHKGIPKKEINVEDLLGRDERPEINMDKIKGIPLEGQEGYSDGKRRQHGGKRADKRI